MNWPWEGYVALGIALWAVIRLGRVIEQLHILQKTLVKCTEALLRKK